MTRAIGLLRQFELGRQTPASLRDTAWCALSDTLGLHEVQALRSTPPGACVERMSLVTDAHSRAPGKPAYHNVDHFKEACQAMAVLCASEFAAHPGKSRLVALGVVAMISHDFLHDGTRNEPGKSLEDNSFLACLPIMVESGLSASDLRVVRSVILGTEDRLLPENRERYAGRQGRAGLGREVDQLRMLANEADLAASLLPGSGQKMGLLLAAEWRASGIEMGQTVASWSCRLGFLRASSTASAAAREIGLESVRLLQIEAFSEVARELGAESPKAAATLLDRIHANSGPQAALAVYARAVSALDIDWGYAAYGVKPVIGNLHPGDPATQTRAIASVFQQVCARAEPELLSPFSASGEGPDFATNLSSRLKATRTFRGALQSVDPSPCAKIP